MAEWVHALDVGAYQFIATVWGMYWPTFLVVVVFTLLERLFPLEPGLPWRFVRFNLVWQVFVLAMTVVLSWTAWGALIGWLSSKAGTPLIFAASSTSPWIEAGRILLVVAIGDLLLYWVHRWSHAVPVLWMVHRFHHEEEHLHAATSLRHHWLNVPIIQLLPLPAALLWGSDPIPAWAGLVVVAIAAFHHSNLRLDMGRLTPFIVGPQLHRIHHARERASHDKNFAAIFPLWDQLFGTYQAPVKATFGASGLVHTKPARNYWLAFVEPLVEWRRMLIGGNNRTR